MTNELETREIATETKAAAADVVGAEELLNRIREDSRVEAERYLAETTVPHGGE